MINQQTRFIPSHQSFHLYDLFVISLYVSLSFATSINIFHNPINLYVSFSCFILSNVMIHTYAPSHTHSLLNFCNQFAKICLNIQLGIFLINKPNKSYFQPFIVFFISYFFALINLIIPFFTLNHFFSSNVRINSHDSYLKHVSHLNPYFKPVHLSKCSIQKVIHPLV